MLSFNGVSLRTPDSLTITYLPPEGATPASRCLMQVEGRWGMLTAQEVKDTLRPALGQGTLVVLDPATGAERTMPAAVVKATTVRTREGYQQVLILREVAVG